MFRIAEYDIETQRHLAPLLLPCSPCRDGNIELIIGPIAHYLCYPYGGLAAEWLPFDCPSRSIQQLRFGNGQMQLRSTSLCTAAFVPHLRWLLVPRLCCATAATTIISNQQALV